MPPRPQPTSSTAGPSSSVAPIKLGSQPNRRPIEGAVGCLELAPRRRPPSRDIAVVEEEGRLAHPRLFESPRHVVVEVAIAGLGSGRRIRRPRAASPPVSEFGPHRGTRAGCCRRRRSAHSSTITASSPIVGALNSLSTGISIWNRSRISDATCTARSEWPPEIEESIVNANLGSMASCDAPDLSQRRVPSSVRGSTNAVVRFGRGWRSAARRLWRRHPCGAPTP